MEATSVYFSYPMSGSYFLSTAHLVIRYDRMGKISAKIVLLCFRKLIVLCIFLSLSLSVIAFGTLNSYRLPLSDE